MMLSETHSFLASQDWLGWYRSRLDAHPDYQSPMFSAGIGVSDVVLGSQFCLPTTADHGLVIVHSTETGSQLSSFSLNVI